GWRTAGSSSTPAAWACRTAGRGHTGPCWPTARSPCGAPSTTPTPPAPPSGTSRATRTRPNGPTTSCAPGPATPTPWPPSALATAAPVSNSPPGPPLAQYASVAHVARVYDYLLGGKDNFA